MLTMPLLLLVASLSTTAMAFRPAVDIGRRQACGLALAAVTATPATASSSVLLTDEERYNANPVDLRDLKLPDGCANAKNLFLVFHGAGGPDRETDDLLARVRVQDAAAGFDRTVALIDWRPWFSSDGARVSWQGQDVGRKLGQLIAQEAPKLQSLHLVGTSAGAWPSDACCTSYVASFGIRAHPPVILSLTDPFTARADAFGEPWGQQHFGERADFAEHYVNTDDIVPSTSEPLPLCYCYDVTRARERTDFALPGGGRTGSMLKDAGMTLLGYHNWPMGYMARHYETQLDKEGRLIIPSHEELPRGAVAQVA
jgi:hypothetical protein